MLGHPTHDPHGDPIPTAEGTLPSHHLENLLTCPLHTALRVTRITDQDPDFLRFVEQNGLKPGEPIEVEARDAAADAVRLRGRTRTPITIGTRAASKLLVEVLAAVMLLLVVAAGPARAQTGPGAADTPEAWPITDNSFLVEEAFNQDPGVFQNIVGWTRDEHGSWIGSFTQEWPAPNLTHQLSYTVPLVGGNGGPHFGGVLLNYRYQVLEEGVARPAFAPRFSVILPDGRHEDDTDRAGIQINLPFSKRTGAIYWHWNAGMTWQRTTTPAVAGSAIWRTTPMFNLLLEYVATFEKGPDGGRDRTMIVSPGFRRGWNFGERQLVIGAAGPISRSSGATTTALLAYFSYELPFR
jgi:hypothetical protein